MAFLDFLFGKPEQIKQYSKYDPMQQQMYEGMMQGGGLQQNPLFQQGSQFLQSLMSGDMSAFQAPLMQQFEQDIFPGISEQFAGLGMGASSGLNQTLARAAENLGGQLGQQRSELMMQMLPQALQFSQAPFEQQRQMLNLQPQGQYLQRGTPGAFGQFASQAAPGVGGMLESSFLDPLGDWLKKRTSGFLGV